MLLVAGYRERRLALAGTIETCFPQVDVQVRSSLRTGRSRGLTTPPVTRCLLLLSSAISAISSARLPASHGCTFPQLHPSRGSSPDLPVSVQESAGQAWGGGGLLQGRGTECSRASWGLLKEATTVFISSTVVWPQVKQQGGNTAPPSNRKLH